ncbi:DUF1670 domain-containing protein [Candidatus Eisenbacteria bacterium]|uniref:DUF1670 domain-containing protein n=1 Tax=Eiseniibacteriota bacterium TaxID=2212470 RepID=A0ABV6YNG9_UNCEI
MVHTPTERLGEKTVERQFLYELERDFELAPATSRALLSAAQQVLFPSGSNGDVREGQVRVTVVSLDEPSGKPLSEMKKVGVVVTVDGGLEDLEVQKHFGGSRLRRVRLLRMSEEAVDQGVVLTQEDLSRLLQAGVRTIRRDVASLRAGGDWVPTRGTVKAIGQGLRFNWRREDYEDRGFPEGTHYGVIAQEAEMVLPEIVSTAPDGERSVAYAELVPVLIESIKELRAENLALSERIEALEGARN